MPLLETGAALAGNAILGIAMQKHNDDRQYNQQRRLTELQAGFDKGMTDYNYSKQLEMWKNTNYSAQKGELNKAGLNPGLMYGMSGGGGTTTGGGGGSQVGGAKAEGNSGEVMQGVGMGIQAAQLGLLQAQKENIEADTELKKTDATKKGGVDTENVATNTANTAQQTENAKLEAIIKKYTGKDMEERYNEAMKVGADGTLYERQATTQYQQSAADYDVAQNITDLAANGKLKQKSNEEIENLILQNATSREQKKNIMKQFDMLESQLKGQNLSNMLQEVETQWAKGTGLKSGSIVEVFGKLLHMLMGRKK